MVDKVARHLSHPFMKPIAPHSLAAFEQANAQIHAQNKPVIFDACCGVGASSVRLAQLHPDKLVIGIDKSAHRLEKKPHSAAPDNLLLLRADLNDMWRLAYWAKWPVAQQAIFYPNPWPKSEHLGRRWHGAPVFPYIVALGGTLTMRSNWKVYLQEFALALAHIGITSRLAALPEGENMTPFEVKYQASGQTCWQLEATLHADAPLADCPLSPAPFRAFFEG